MFLSQFTTVVVVLLAFSAGVVEPKTEETLKIKLFDHEALSQLSDSEKNKMYKKADLEGHGYKKEVITKLVQKADNDQQEYLITYFFYKKVNCSQMQKIAEELNNLLPGASGQSMIIRFREEIKNRGLLNLRHCKVGMEIHVVKSEACNKQKKASTKRKKRQTCICESNCIVVEGDTE